MLEWRHTGPYTWWLFWDKGVALEFFNSGSVGADFPNSRPIIWSAPDCFSFRRCLSHARESRRGRWTSRRSSRSKCEGCPCTRTGLCRKWERPCDGGATAREAQDADQRGNEWRVSPRRRWRIWLSVQGRSTSPCRQIRPVDGSFERWGIRRTLVTFGKFTGWMFKEVPQHAALGLEHGRGGRQSECLRGAAPAGQVGSPATGQAQEQSENPVIGHGPGSHLRRSRTCTMARRGAMPPSRKRQERQWVGGERPRMQHQSPDCPCSRSAGARVAYSGRLGQHCAGQREPDHAASLTPARSLRTHWTSCLPRSFTMCPLTMCMRTSTTAWTLRQMKTLCVPWQLLRVSTCQRI